MTNKEKLEILKKVCFENIDCKDCKALGVYDDCRNNRTLTCEQVVNKVIEEALSNLEKEKCELLGLIQAKDEQIEKMKCCSNCEHFNFNETNYCNKGVFRERQYVCGQWELVK